MKSFLAALVLLVLLFAAGCTSQSAPLLAPEEVCPQLDKAFWDQSYACARSQWEAQPITDWTTACKVGSGWAPDQVTACESAINQVPCVGPSGLRVPTECDQKEPDQ